MDGDEHGGEPLLSVGHDDPPLAVANERPHQGSHGVGRIFIVEPTGPSEDDPNLTHKKFPGNPTKSYRSRDPLRVIRELTDWAGHPPDVLQAMKDNLERLEQLGIEAIDD